MVQAEVADRLVAPPGSKTYGVPSVKLAWYGSGRRVGSVPPAVFWPVPNVDSGLVRLERRDPPSTAAPRERVFALVDAAFAQRRKMLRQSVKSLGGETLLEKAGIEQVRIRSVLTCDAGHEIDSVRDVVVGLGPGARKRTR